MFSDFLICYIILFFEEVRGEGASEYKVRCLVLLSHYAII